MRNSALGSSIVAARGKEGFYHWLNLMVPVFKYSLLSKGKILYFALTKPKTNP
jgi:hypothetical protein